MLSKKYAGFEVQVPDEVITANAEFMATIMHLPPEQRQKVMDVNLELLKLETPEPDTSGVERQPIAANKPVITLQGAGFGKRLDREEGIRRLMELAEPMPLEGWAGDVAGATELAKHLGIPRSTLQEWHRRKAVIGLLKGISKRVYPLDQFIDSRPVEGIARIQEIIGDPRLAWRWLITEKPESMKARPLDLLKQGRVEEVVIAAERDFA